MLKGHLTLIRSWRDIFTKIKLKGTKPSKFNVKGTLHLNWFLKGYFHENHAKRDQTWVLKGHVMLKGTKPLKINVKGTLHLNWVLKGYIMLKGTRPLKIIVKGTLYLNWVLKGQFHDIFWSMWIKYFLGLQPLLGHFGPILGLENNFWPYFVHLLTNLVKKKFWA